MPIIESKDGSIILEVNLVKNLFLEIDSNGNDLESWIPFELFFKVDNEYYAYDKASGSTFTLHELKDLISELNKVIASKKSFNNFDRYEFCCLERYFEVVFFDPMEKGEVYLDFWINMGEYTKGAIKGFDKGFRFVLALDNLSTFCSSLELQLNDILADY